MQNNEVSTNRTKYQEIIEKIQNYISEYKLGPGDRLPSERNLSLLFGVNRSSLREAIRILVTLQILEVKTGSGVYITTSNIDPSFELLHLKNRLGFLNEQVDTSDSLEIRYLLEMHSVRKICLRKDDVELSDIVKMLEDQKNDYLSGNNVEKLDREFHLELARVSGNKLLVGLLNSIYDLSMQRRVLYFKNKNRIIESYNDHVAIIEALMERNLSGAETIMALHLERAPKLWDSIHPIIGEEKSDDTN